MDDAPPKRKRGRFRKIAIAAGASAIGRRVVWAFTRWAEFGTSGYPPDVRHRLMILNMIGALIILTTGGYAVQHTFIDYEKYRPIILINTALLLVALVLPLLHRLGPIVAGVTLVVCEYAAFVAFSAYLGRNSGVHLQYFVAAAATFVVLGLERLRLILVITAAGLALHLFVWFNFLPELARFGGDTDVVNGIYVQAAITTMGLTAATVWYAFSLVEQARGETEALLRNVLPGSVVERLKARPTEGIADTFDDASVLFADISGFVPLARELGAARVVALLNLLVSEFDAVAIRHGIEKIKTIGDAYMAAGGIPVHTKDHTERLVLMAQEMLAIVARVRAETGLRLHVRVGIASGPVMAGVIGRNKFSYDVWGDTVNLAARLESQSEPGRILVCPTCREQLDGRFDFESKGIIQIKGIGATEAWLVAA